MSIYVRTATVVNVYMKELFHVFFFEYGIFLYSRFLAHIYICMYECMCIDVYVYLHVRMYIFTYMHIYILIYLCVHIYLHIHIYTNIGICMFVYHI